MLRIISIIIWLANQLPQTQMRGPTMLLYMESFYTECMYACMYLVDWMFVCTAWAHFVYHQYQQLASYSYIYWVDDNYNYIQYSYRHNQSAIYIATRYFEPSLQLKHLYLYRLDPVPGSCPTVFNLFPEWSTFSC